MASAEHNSTDDNADLYPSNLILQQVQILLRHGERTPTTPRFRNAGLSADWPYCNAANNLRSVIRTSQSWDLLTWKRSLEYVNEHETSAIKPYNTCLPSELTDKGRATTFAFGQRLRDLYVTQLGFLPQTFEEPHQQHIRLRSTPRERCIESIQQAFAGLYPAMLHTLSVPNIVTRAMQDETLTPNEASCRRLAELGAAFGQRAAKIWNNSPEMQYIDRQLKKWMPNNQSVKVDSHPRLSGIMDTVHATLAHGPGTRLPEEFYDGQVQAAIDKITTEEWFAGFRESNEYRRLGIGALLGDLTQSMVECVTLRQQTAKFCLMGCHDSTIGATLASLGCYQYLEDRWPRFTSSVTFELFGCKGAEVTTIDPSRESNPPPSESITQVRTAREPLSTLSVAQRRSLDGFFVRVKYNDRPIVIPFCREPGRHLTNNESFCTLRAFKEAADTMTPVSWKSECEANLGNPPIPDPLEPPPGVKDVGR